jgi:hypothetical protein
MIEMLYDFNTWLGDSWIAQIILIYVVGYLGYKHGKAQEK